MLLLHSSSVYVEGDIETRVYNDSISSEVKSIPEICVRRDGMYVHIVDPDHQFVAELRFFCVFVGKIRLIKYGESISKISFDELSKLSFFIQLIFPNKEELFASVFNLCSTFGRRRIGLVGARILPVAGGEQTESMFF